MITPGPSGSASQHLLIKICGITECSDGQHALEAGATALGFNFYPHSARYLTPEKAGTIISSLHGQYLRVGVFVNATRGELDAATRLAGLDVLQLHGTVPALLPLDIAVWRAVPVNEVPARDARFSAYLLDTPCATFGGSGQVFDWSLAAAFGEPVILAGGLRPENVAEAIAAVRPRGVDACSRLESRPGRKDPRLVEAFVQAARQAHLSLQHNESIVTA